MNDRLPVGRLLRSRVVDDPGTVLADALDRGLTGCATLEPQGTLLSTGADRGVLVFEAGVPRLAYHPRTGGGEPALSAMAGPGPCRVELWEAPAGILPEFEAPGPSVPPGAAAERLADDPALADRTRRRAPDAGDASAVEAFLDDETAVESVREAARAEAERRAAEWGLEHALGDREATREDPDRPIDG